MVKARKLLKPRAGKIPKVAIHGKAAHNSAFLCAIGNLIVNWANNESVFMAMLQLYLVGGKHSAAIVWHSHRTTNARLELIGGLSRERLQDKDLIKDINTAISRFKGFTGTRNFYCHATYDYTDDLCLSSASSTTLTQGDYPLKFERRPMDLATLNEISHASTEMGTFNRDLWKLVFRLQTALGVQHEVLPPQLREQKSYPDDQPHQEKAHEREGPP